MVFFFSSRRRHTIYWRDWISDVCSSDLTVCGCGAAAGPVRGDSELTLLLGSRPAGVHAGIFLAVERGFDEAEGLELTIRRSGDAARLLRSGRVDAAILEAPLPGTVCVM